MDFQPYISERELRAQKIRSAAAADRATLVTELLAGIKHSDPQIRSASAEALGWIQESSAIPKLTELLFDEVEWVRDRSGFALRQMKKEALPHLLNLCQKAKTREGYMGLERALVRMGESASISLTQILVDGEAGGRLIAAKVMGQLKHFRMEEIWPIFEAANPQDQVSLLDMIRSAGKIEAFEYPAQWLESDKNNQESKKILPKIRIALSRLARVNKELFFEALKTEPYTDATRIQILEALARADIAGLSPLIHPFAIHEKAGLRIAAAKLLARTKEAAGKTALQHLLEDPQASVRSAAIEGMGKFRTPEFRQVLLSRLEKEDLSETERGQIESVLQKYEVHS